MDKRKILIIDDEPDFTQMVKLNLEATGNYEVIREHEGMRAVATALVYKPDLILLDVIMPDIEGPEVAFQIRRNQILNTTPIVFLTATITKEEVKTERGVVGGNTFLAKPGTVQELVECIERKITARQD